MPRESVEAKAARYLLEGRVTVYQANANVIRARVQGNGDQYVVVVTRGGYACNCLARSDRCCHVIAVQRITNRPTTPPRRTP